MMPIMPMTRLLSTAVAAVALLLSACSTAPTHPALKDSVVAQAPLLPVRHFVADLESSGAHQISPDGRRLMWMARQGVGPALFVKDLDTGAVRSYAVRAPGVWARDSRHVLIHLDQGGNENTHLLEFDASAERLDVRDLTPFAGARSFLHAQLDDSADLLIESNRCDPKVFDLYRLERASGELKLLARNPGDVALWLTDRRTGRLIGRAARRGEQGAEQWALEQPEPKSPESKAPDADAAAEPVWRERFRVDFFDTLQPLQLSDDDTFLWALSNRGRDKLALVKVNLQDGAEQVVLQDPRADLSGVVFSRRTRQPLAVSLDPDVQEWRALDPAFGAVIERLKGSGPVRLAFMGGTDDDDVIVASVVRPDGGENLLYRRSTGAVELLSTLTRGRLSQRAPLGVPQPVQFTSRDGLDLHGYLTLPPGAPKDARLPTVLYVHGGPWARDLHLWNDPMPIFLASRGYAVLQVNYRGSTGYGRAFRDASAGQFARGMHTDLLDALDGLVRQGTTDPARVAIMGLSYGGYASLVGMTFTPERFSCGISAVGMSDLARLLEHTPPYWDLGLPMWRRFAGDPADPQQRAELDARSPIFRANQPRGPILLLHGANDPRVKLDQSQRMLEALHAAGKPAELHVFERAGHGFHRWQDNLRYYRLTEDFLAGCLGGRSAGFDVFEVGAWLF